MYKQKKKKKFICTIIIAKKNLFAKICAVFVTDNIPNMNNEYITSVYGVPNVYSVYSTYILYII